MARIYDNIETKFAEGLQGIVTNVGVKRVDFCVGYFNLWGEEGNETVTNCHQLKLKSEDGKMRLTDVADTGPQHHLFHKGQ